MTTETKLLIGVLAVTVLIIAGAGFMASRNQAQQNTSISEAEPVSNADRLVRDDSPTAGPEDAAVTVVEFGDFECPACGAAHPVLEQVKEQFADQGVAFVFRQFPLTNIHEHAQLAAEASLAAKNQGKFWEYHDLLFENQSALEREDLVAYAEQLELNLEQFNRELDEGDHANQVQQAISDGRAAGVTGTPTFFINGKRYQGQISAAAMSSAIESELAN